MDIKSYAKTALGSVTVLGQRDGDQVLWSLSTRVMRVPLGAGNKDGNTPGVQGLRTLWMRSVPRGIKVRSNGREPYLHPTLLELFSTREDFSQLPFELQIDGVKAKAKLIREQRVWVSPVDWQPDYQPSAASQLYVSPYLLEDGAFLLDTTDPTWSNLLPGMVAGSEVQLDREGVVYLAEVPPADNSTPIKTLLRLSKVAGELIVTLLPERQDATALKRWREVWSAMRSIAQSTRVTAWSRLHFDLGNTLPALIWSVTRVGNAFQIRWRKTRLPAGLVTVTLADQPTESQLFGPEQVLTLVPEDVSFDCVGTTITVSTADLATPEVSYSYSDKYALGSERLAFSEPAGMVYSATQVDTALRAAYAPLIVADPVTGFMKVTDGWLELPFASTATLPAKRPRTDAANAHGSLLIGLRRRSFYPPGTSPWQTPWSIRLDEPEKYSIKWVFKAGRLASAEIRLTGSATQVRGLFWLSNRAPDGDDALPVVDEHTSAFFDVVLDGTEPTDKNAPLILSDLMVLAPQLPKNAREWDSIAPSARAPALADTLKITLKPPILPDHSLQRKQRLWMRHPTLPSIQTMPETRADMASARPHASRAMALFEREPGALTLTSVVDMEPQLDPRPGKEFTAVPISPGSQAELPGTLVALTLPGIELIPQTPTRYQAMGSYGLPLLDETYARAVLPPPQNVTVPLATDPPPVAPTALQPDRLRALREERALARGLAATQLSLMFPAGAMNTPINLMPTALAQPRNWLANVVVNGALTITSSTLEMGSVSFSQGTAMLWRASGNALLAGLSDDVDFTKANTVTISAGAATPMKGWSVAERLAGSDVVDGRGVAWSTQLIVADNLFKRELRIEMPEAADQTRVLVSTATPFTVIGVGLLPWRFALTDLPLTNGKWKVVTQTDPRLLGVEQGWTWALYQSGANDIAALPLLGMFRFTPAALKSVQLDAAGLLSTVLIEGAMTLGLTATEPADDTRCRVALSLSYKAGGLMLTAVQALDDTAHGRMAWNLAAEVAPGQIVSGVPQLSGIPKLAQGAIILDDARLEATVFGADLNFPLGSLSSASPINTLALPAPAALRVFALESLTLDLIQMRLVKVQGAVKLREGVTLSIAEQLNSEGEHFQQVGGISWFGNSLQWTAAQFDGRRAAICLANPVQSSVVLFPETDGVSLSDGVASLALNTPNAAGQFELASYFVELQFKAWDSLIITHMLHSIGPHDDLRFDGTLNQQNFVIWPDLDIPVIGQHDSVEVQLATPRHVLHSVRLQFADHRLDGSRISQAQGQKGLALSGERADSPAVNWLVEATHRFEWMPNGSLDVLREVQCLHPLQLWGARWLAGAVEAVANQFGFTPSYQGRATPAMSPKVGVGGVVAAYAGIISPALAVQLKLLGDCWCMLGGMTVLVPTTADSEYRPLHLPIIGALCDPVKPESVSALQKLRGLLGVPALSAGSTLRMSRHDVQTATVMMDVHGLPAPGRLATTVAADSITATIAGQLAAGLSGSALTQGWFGAQPQDAEPGWQAEQLQMPGDKAVTVMPAHPFPRGAAMLAAWHAQAVPRSQPALSVLVRFTGTKTQSEVTVQTVRVQPVPVKGDDRPPILADETPVDLVVGTADGLLTVALDSIEAQSATAGQMLALALRVTAAPLFIIRRQAQASGAGSFTRIDLPRRSLDPLDFVARALRAASPFATDGRLTWPEQQDAWVKGATKAQFDFVAGPRIPFQQHEEGIVGVCGSLAPARVAGDAFTLDPPSAPRGEPVPSTVWLQEWDRIAYDGVVVDPQDAPPRAYDSQVAALPLAPSSVAVAAALRRLDPELSKNHARVQTCLPQRIDDISLSNRSGAMAATGARILRTWAVDAEPGDWMQALAGPAFTRSMRAPRPAGLPENLGKPETWQRPVGWYGDKTRSCLALAGRWDMLLAAPDASDIPPWTLLLGNPLPYASLPGVTDQCTLWRGAVKVECKMLHAGSAASQTPAAEFLQLLEHAKGRVLRAGLRCGLGYVTYVQVEQVDATHLVFWPGPLAQNLTGTDDCQFEFGMAVDVGTSVTTPSNPFDLPVQARTELDPVDFRQLSLLVTPPELGTYALPLVRRTIFFADPAYDQRLSRFNPASRTLPATERGDDGFTFWADRTEVTASEYIVLHLYDNSHVLLQPYQLSAQVIRRSDKKGPQVLNFQLGGAQAMTSVPMSRTFVVLPLSILADDAGKALVTGDVLVLNLKYPLDGQSSAQLSFPVNAGSAMPLPEALYSLLAVDSHGYRAWCALHSGNPQADGLDTHVVDADLPSQRMVRKALFRWSYVQAPVKYSLAFSICKTDLATESTYIPEKLEDELD
jgi:hypothetical protein